MGFKKSLALNASAGSGKTFALSVRYIALLLKGAKPSSIVALTFTKKAANEMKERVFDTLQNLEKKLPELNELCAILNLDKKDVLSMRDSILNNFLEDNIKISTIDSFFGLILKKFALHLGLIPDFTSVPETNNEQLLQKFIEKSKREGAYNSLINFANSSKQNIKKFLEIFIYLYENDSQISQHKQPRSPYPSEDDVLSLANKIKEHLEKKGASTRAIDLFPADVEVLASKDFWERETLNYRTFSKVYTQELDDMVFELRDLMKIFYQQKESYLLGEFLFLYKLYKNARRSEAKQKNELSFTDITNAVYSLLHEYIDNEFLYFRLDSKIDHLLIDEFQDTSIVQYKILEPIIEEICAGVGVKENKSFFYVGDIKQSIYRFRGGEKTLFFYVTKKFNVEVDSLLYNYRSSKKVVDFVNEVFNQKILNYENQKSTKENGYVEVFICKDDCDAIDELYIRVEELINQKILQQDIAILCTTNSDAELVSKHLKNKGFHVTTESTPLLINSKNVEIVIEFLKFAYFKDELFGRAFQCLIGESFKTLPSLDGFDFFDNPTKAITWIIDKFSLSLDLDLLKFLELSLKFKDIENLLFKSQDISEKALLIANDSIKVLTVHKSKGLEFPYVFVFDKITGENTSRKTLLYEYTQITLKNIYFTMTNRKEFDAAYKEALEKEAKLEKEEKLNIQYVAFTRAKQGLIIIQKNKDSWFKELLLEDRKIGRVIPSESFPQKIRHKNLEYENCYFGVQHNSAKESCIAQNTQNIYFGLALHYTLEMMSSFDEKSLELALIFSKNRYGHLLDDKAFVGIKKRVANIFENYEFKKIISEGKLYKEQPFIYQGKQKQIDLMVESNEKIVIIDYKSSFRGASSHETQVKEYKEALEKIIGKKVEAYLLYLQEDKTKILSL